MSNQKLTEMNNQSLIIKLLLQQSIQNKNYGAIIIWLELISERPVLRCYCWGHTPRILARVGCIQELVIQPGVTSNLMPCSMDEVHRR